ncbi:toprim domain-containing protein [Sporosarcina psychrophila]|uniref:5S rRNA maturation endonuclease (Ribonuclease M5) n=1 Tax=Sporosarcina psychrophila TaxID=1476 RepID=A0ABV2KC47_SPOPS
MPIIRIGPHEVDIDITAELEGYDWGYNARWSADKLIADSPFRHDSTPSFYVNLTGDYAGVFGDSGAVDDDYVSGGIVKLLAYLRGEGEAETADYLLSEYGRLYTDAEDIRLPALNIRKRTKYRTLAPDIVTQATSPYLLTRGISPEAQRQYGVGYGATLAGYTAMPWYSPDGRLANVKYRSTTGKRFFYEKGATPIRQLVYGLNVVNANRSEMAVINEAEIDVQSWAVAGVPAIACGGSSISHEQIDAIKRSSIRKLLLGGDNDAAGQRLNAEVKRLLSGYVELYDVDYGRHNDANDILESQGTDGLRQLSNFTVTKLRDNGLHFRNLPVILS